MARSDLSGAPAPSQPPSRINFQQAAIVSGRMFVVERRKLTWNWDESGSGAVLRGEAVLVGIDLEGKVPRTEYGLLGSYDSRRPFRWKIGSECFWGTGAVEKRTMEDAIRLPFPDLPIWDIRNQNPRADFLKKYKRRHVSPYDWPLNPVANAAVNEPEVKPNEICFDICPTSTREMTLFLLQGGKMQIHQGSGKFPPGNLEWVVTWEQTDEFDVAFQEQFSVYVHGSRVFFVTLSGKLYASKHEGKKWYTELIWKDEKRPIVTAIADVAKCTTFLLARGDPEGPVIVFELDSGGRVKQQTLQAGDVKWPRSNSPLDVCLPFAQYLLEKSRLSELRR